jgi:hypothetical protein
MNIFITLLENVNKSRISANNLSLRLMREVKPVGLFECPYRSSGGLKEI